MDLVGLHKEWFLVSFEVIGSDSVSWDIMSCRLVEVYLLSEEHIASVFRVEE
jgi:hypothetical protein